VLSFGLLSAIWGARFALIKVAVDAGVPPVLPTFSSQAPDPSTTSEALGH
jgi:hypothetical protein